MKFYVLVKFMKCVILNTVSYCSPNSVSTLRGSYGRCQGRCLIKVLSLGPGIFPINFSIKWLL